MAVHVIQRAPQAFRVPFLKHGVIEGIQCSGGFTGAFQLSAALARRLKGGESLICVSQELASFVRHARIAAVNHGIWWDGDFPAWKKSVIKVLHKRLLYRCQATICVDSNYINWCHAELSGRQRWQAQLRYIPNYADTSVFQPVRGHVQPQNTTVLFPRRLEEPARGAALFLDAVKTLHARGQRVNAILCGPGALRAEILSWAAENGLADFITLEDRALDEMVNAYQNATVVVVPSTAHEGTSLSALEAMAMRRALVVTHIGGLPNIVVDNMNGYVSDLSSAVLADKIQAAISRNPLADEAVWKATIESIRIERWRRQVWDALAPVLT